MRKDKESSCSLAEGLGRAAAIGLIAAVVLSVLFLLLGLCVKGFRLTEALLILRSGLLISGSLMWFVVAGMLLFPRRGQKMQEQQAWKDKFGKLGLLPVMAIAAAIVLASGIAVDYLTF